MTMTDRRIIWTYTDGEHEPVAMTAWATRQDFWPRTRLETAGREGVAAWKYGEPLDDVFGLAPLVSWVPPLDVEYLPGAYVSGGDSRSITWRIEERSTDALFVLHNTTTGEVFDAHSTTKAEAWAIFTNYQLGDDDRTHFEVITRGEAHALSARGGAMTHGVTDLPTK